jgi:hypothetical protein
MRFLILLCMLLVPLLASADSLITSIEVIPAHPEPMEPVLIRVSGSMPNGCWSLGDVGDHDFMLIDVSGPGIDCTAVIVPFTVEFELGGLAEGFHWYLIRETHDSLYDPGTWSEQVEFQVGNPPTANEARTWSILKALYR